MGQNWVQNQIFCYFLKFGSLVFLESTNSDSLQQYLTSSRGKIHEKNLQGPNLGERGQSQAQNQVFAIYSSLFHQFSLNEITYSDNLQQCIISSRRKTNKKKFGDQIFAKIGPKTRSFAIFSSLAHQFSLKLYTMIACNDFLHLVEVKSTKKKSLGPKCGPKRPKLGPKLGFCHFLKFS